ncbi:MAG TPA: electron transfer flavoprotein subunit alpha/FixB family protein [Longimicrobiaceae bacterium]|jgi:electron transfer flavoprotein alpha subunit|nr:electron transfer flavoprotein subunit alpha/FixB family protein [Longimicrobiaceae bacterium]
MAGIFAFAESRDGELRKVAHEVVTAARTVADAMGTEVHAVLLGGPGTGAHAAELGQHGADKVFVGESGAFAHYSAEGFTTVIAGFIKEHGCDVAIFPATSMGKDLAPRVAARLGVGYVSEVTSLEVEGGSVVATRPEYSGKVFARVSFGEKPAVLSVRPNVFTATENAKAGAVETLDVSVNEADFGAIVREIKAAAGEKLDVGEAPIIVSGGRGLKEPENFKMLEELADAFKGKAAVGASRAVVDAGWRPHSEQVGQTGKTVAPTLYFAIGISGAIQHLAGMRTSRFIVAINKDPEAPIFKIADYGIVGDLFQIVPRLTEEVRKMM